MKRFIPLSFLFIFHILSADTTSIVWAHSGHKHDELKIKLPKVVARVNDHDISGDIIFRELKKAAIQYKKRGMPLNADQLLLSTNHVRRPDQYQVSVHCYPQSAAQRRNNLQR